MDGVLFIICVTIFRMAAAKTENKSVLLKKIDATENLVRELLVEVDKLKSEDKLQRSQIAHMENQLRVQQQRSTHLEKLIRKFTAYTRRKTPLKTENSPVLTPEKQSPQTKDGRSKNRIRRAENETPVAFFAKMGSHLDHAGIHQTFIFEIVVTNVGNAYNNHLGVFVAPVAGTYVFSTTLVSSYHVNAHAQFVKNGKAITTMFVSGGESGHDTTSQTIVLQLQKGDDVSVQNLDSDKSFYGSSHSTFSGFLLQEDYTSSVVVGK
ncbi:complement C1q-like protein 2 [Mercenaria mercenaria]|uniref:complement C1q-like protein 2 n=1 Tax=Mercenaria mercenaria TaxID=6596 RepID=UPI00234E62EB|nr:complement C1q-like protein 2 [Mercenaria mercenaria]